MATESSVNSTNVLFVPSAVHRGCNEDDIQVGRAARRGGMRFWEPVQPSLAVLEM